MKLPIFNIKEDKITELIIDTSTCTLINHKWKKYNDNFIKNNIKNKIKIQNLILIKYIKFKFKIILNLNNNNNKG